MPGLRLASDFLQLTRRSSNPWKQFTRFLGQCIFKVTMDVSDYRQSDLSITVVDDTIIIRGRSDRNNTINEFVHSYPLPYGYSASRVTSNISPDGLLTVCVPKPDEPGRIIPIRRY